ncbi:hypothetical protein AVEN_231647-1 [Araneus ventricosus]|uniref:Uncharacterized protein n=1 Tax=Araneus ventricosus TaxID=182803 RepID=A0A4Y2QRL6_ARAVE|nr:hypothetical protein AVEN_231647-1 [Araneus ventricosus]
MEGKTAELVAEFIGSGTIPCPMLCIKVTSDECCGVVSYQGLQIHGVLAIIVRGIIDYVSAVKKSTAPSTQTNPDISISSSNPPGSIARASPPITNLPISSSPSVSPVSEEALASPDFTDFKFVTNKKKLRKDSPTKTNNSIAKAEKISKFYTSSRREVLNIVPTKDNICTHQSALKPFETHFC